MSFPMSDNHAYASINRRIATFDSQYYKFLHSDHVNLVLGGSLKFSSAERFRRLETEYNDQWIGDAREGLDVYPIKDGTQKISHPDGGESIIWGKDNKIIREVNALILSISFGPSDKLYKTFKDEPSRYDAAIKISNIKRFARAIWDTGTVHEKPVNTLCSHYGIGFCNYVEKSELTLEWGNNPFNHFFGIDPRSIPAPDIFTKDIKYKSQREYRIVLFPKLDWSLEEEVFVNFTPK